VRRQGAGPELLVTPRGKGDFKRKVKKNGVETIEPGQRWRIETKWCRNIGDPRDLSIIAAMAANAPDIPFRPGDNVVDTLLVEEQENDGF